MIGDDEGAQRPGPGEVVGPWAPSWAVARMAAATLVTVCIVFSFVGLMITHQFGALDRWDNRVNAWMVGHRNGSVDRWTGYATRVADTFGIIAVLMVTVALLVITRRRWEALLLALALALELSCFLIVNTLVDRPRPDVVRLGSLPSTSSFPSGHTAAMIVMYGGLAVIFTARFRSWWAGALAWTLVALATMVIGLSRVYRGLHHPSDVVAGALLGLCVLVGAINAVQRGATVAASRRREDDPTPWTEPSPVMAR